MDTVKELLMNADISFENRQLDEALKWYQKVLEKEPENVYALSRAGAICVGLKDSKQAVVYFTKAMLLDPKNGDNAFNFANACFFNGDFAKALELYTNAANLGCSEDVTPRLYYQLALMCIIRQDIKNALVNFEKCEDADTSGHLILSPDFISEKMKAFMMVTDYENAKNCASQLIAMEPANFRNYLLKFSFLMADHKYDEAAATLSEAEKYAELSDDDKFNLLIQNSAVNTKLGEVKNDDSYITKACESMEAALNEGNLSGDKRTLCIQTLAEAYLQKNESEKAISLLALLLGETKAGGEIKEITVIDEEFYAHELTPEELEEMINADMAKIQERIDIGEMDGDMGLYAVTDYDEEGNPVHYYDDPALSAAPVDTADEKEEEEAPQDLKVSKAIKDKTMFTLLTAFLAKEDFASVQKIAVTLKDNENKYYSYYGIYAEALAEKELTGNSDKTQKLYAAALAYFRTKTFEDSKDSLAAIFRARLYAEQGKLEKAKEIAYLLSEEDRASILAYIEKLGQ